MYTYLHMHSGSNLLVVSLTLHVGTRGRMKGAILRQAMVLRTKTSVMSSIQSSDTETNTTLKGIKNEGIRENRTAKESLVHVGRLLDWTVVPSILQY